MGITRVTTTIRDLAKKGTPHEAEFLVDTSAIDCLAPKNALVAAGIDVEGKAVYELADREPIEFEYGFARIGLLGDETVAQIIFGPDDAEPILGVVTLENLGLAVDPVTQNIKRLRAKPLK